MKRYPKYKDSGASWLGQVPEHWELGRLGSYVSLRGEKGSDKEFTPLSVTKQGVVPQLETAAKTDDGDNRKVVRRGDLAINGRSDRKGSSGLAEMDGSVSLINIILKIDRGLHPKFAHHLIRSFAFQEEFYRWGRGIVADLWSTNYWDLKRIPTALPPLDEQRKIAEFVDAAISKMDAAISSQERMIELLQERRSAIITQAVTKGLDPNIKMKDSGVPWLGQVPAHWGVTLVGRLFSIELGKMLQPSKPDETDVLVPYLRSANIQWGRVDISDVKEMWFSGSEIKKLRLEKDDLLVCEGGDAGRSCLWRGEMDLCCFQKSVIRVRGDASTDIRHMAYWMRFLKEKGYVDMVCNKSTIAHFTSEKVARAPYLKMPHAEQVSIVRHLDLEVSKIDSVIQSQEQLIQQLKERRSALITQVVTGQVDVR